MPHSSIQAKCSQDKGEGWKNYQPFQFCSSGYTVFLSDVSDVVVSLFPDKEVFDDDEAVDKILGLYFSLVSAAEAKELVMDAYEKYGH